jgi:hypothetical protein
MLLNLRLLSKREYSIHCGPAFTNFASACQCLGCGRYPCRILPAYQRETPIADRITDVGVFASNGLIFSEKTSLVSQAGWLVAFQTEHASACRRREAECLARLSGLSAATRPSFAALTSRSVAPPIAQSAQWVCRCSIVFPHPRQTFSLLGRVIGLGKDGAPFASRLCCFVNRVAGILP